MPNWLIWTALAVGAVASLGGLAFLAVRLLQSWRDLKRVRRHVLKALERLNDTAELAAKKAAAAGDTAELEKSLGKLRRSLAQLAVLREAAGEARDLVDRVAVFVPRA